MPSKVTAEVIADYHSGTPLAELLSKYGISKTQFYRRIKSENKRGPRDRFTEAEWLQIIKEYETKDLMKIVEDWNSSHGMIKSGLEERGIILRTISEAVRTYTKDEESQAIQNYLDGQPAKLAGKFCEASEPTVLRWLSDNNIQRRHQPNYGGNKDFFKTLDTEAAAYWFGFLCADGNITKKKYVRVLLSSKDYEHLIYFQKTINYTKPIKVYKKIRYWEDRPPKEYEYARTLIGCRRMVKDLIRHGLLEIKAGKWDKLEGLNETAFRHFLRGYFDGDGCISKSGKNYSWMICGQHKEILEYFMERCYAVWRTNAHKQAKIWRVSYCGNLVVKRICEWLYDDATVYLGRKHKRAMRCLEKK